jgi:hypothetical protein
LQVEFLLVERKAKLGEFRANLSLIYSYS